MDNTLKSKYQRVIAIFQKDLDIITDYLLFCCPITDVSTKTPLNMRHKMVSQQKMSLLGERAQILDYHDRLTIFLQQTTIREP